MNRMRALWRRLQARVGRRGVALLFFALLDVVFAVSLAATPPSTSGGYEFLSTILPLWVWAIPWGVVGCMCLVQAFAVQDRVAFVAASALKAGWGVLYLAGFLAGEIPRGYVAAVIWLAFAGFVAVISGWPEPVRGR
jgi:hypothetical protein